MSYCTVTDVETLMQIKFSLNSRPNLKQVKEIIAAVAAELDGVVQAAGYTVPVTATAAKAVLTRENTLGAACECWHAGYISDTAPARAEYWCEQYAAFLNRLRKGEQQLPGLTPTSDLDPAFAIAPQVARDPYWGRGEDTLLNNED